MHLNSHYRTSYARFSLKSGMPGDFVILRRALTHLYEIQPINLNLVHSPSVYVPT